MTLPKIFSLASKNFNNFNTLSFEESTIRISNSSLSNQEQQQQHRHHDRHQSEQNSQQILSSLNPLHTTMSSISTLPDTTISVKNNTIFEDNANGHDGREDLSPPLLQLISENQESQSLAECVMPGIYLTKDFISWTEEQLRAHGFTHIIIIDKHIQELYYPNQQLDIFKLCPNENTEILRHDARSDNNSSSLNAFDCYCPPPPPPATAANRLNFGKEFHVIDLNFGEKSYLTTVLPNCYRAVKFINKALQAGGKMLVIDCNGGEQKCITIIVAYLMYKHNITFINAFGRLKEFYNKADLDRFYIRQLYEYEPILQVQRAQSRGHSCSRKLHAAFLKRKKVHDDEDATLDNNITYSAATSCCYSYTNPSTYTNATTTTELLNNCNPLNQFDSTQMERQEMNLSNHHHHNHNYSLSMPQHNRNTTPTFTNVMTSSTTTTTTTSGWYNWDDYAME